jgi:hypothetical protein
MRLLGTLSQMYDYPRRFGAGCITVVFSSFFSNNPSPIIIEMYLNISVVKGDSYEYKTIRIPVV